MKRLFIISLLIIVRNGYKRARLLRRLNYFFKQGDNCFFSTHLFGTEPKHIAFGNNVWVATRVSFITHDVSVHLVKNYLKDKSLNFDFVGYIKIGNNVFLGANTCILPNVNITNNVIIGANSIITKSISKSGVYAGTPLRYIKSFDDFCDDCIQNHTEYPWSNTIKNKTKKELNLLRFKYIKKYLVE